MGLDITYRSKIRKAAESEGLLPVDPEYPNEPPETDYDNGYFRIYPNDFVAGQSDGLEGVYRDEGESAHFRAGSYSGYNQWRERLAELAGYEPSPHPGILHAGEPSSAATVWADPKPGPFVELINFSDCEGVIGPVTSAKLAQDFAAFQEQADAVEDWEGWFREQYAKWRTAFETAAQGGCVEFH